MQNGCFMCVPWAGKSDPEDCIGTAPDRLFAITAIICSGKRVMLSGKIPRIRVFACMNAGDYFTKW